MVSRLVLDLVERVGAAPAGATVQVRIEPGQVATVAAWCARTGNDLVVADERHAVVRRGRAVANAADESWSGARLWLYTNFDCNLACDYCCARSSPHAPRRALGLDRIRRLVTEGTDAGVREVLLTGGEPFLLTDLDQIVAACVARAPTTLLTNGMLFRGSRLAMLRRMPRDRLALQISLDSATPDRHDRHRGGGSWRRAYDGIATARAEGFRVRVAATLVPSDVDKEEEAALQRLLDELGIPPADRVVRPVARRGAAEDGVPVTAKTLVPEVTVTADGVYWHPVGADHADQLVTTRLFPLGAALDEIRRRYAAYRRDMAEAAQRFPCA
jgi:pyruvate-formate lyase-activating enzyme